MHWAVSIAMAAIISTSSLFADDGDPCKGAPANVTIIKSQNHWSDGNYIKITRVSEKAVTFESCFDGPRHSPCKAMGPWSDKTGSNPKHYLLSDLEKARQELLEKSGYKAVGALALSAAMALGVRPVQNKLGGVADKIAVASRDFAAKAGARELTAEEIASHTYMARLTVSTYASVGVLGALVRPIAALNPFIPLNGAGMLDMGTLLAKRCNVVDPESMYFTHLHDMVDYIERLDAFLMAIDEGSRAVAAQKIEESRGNKALGSVDGGAKDASLGSVPTN